ncbi:hypothetical protein SGLAM104S_06103 [Streptomyces glaucescens]
MLEMHGRFSPGAAVRLARGNPVVRPGPAGRSLVLDGGLAGAR